MDPHNNNGRRRRRRRRERERERKKERRSSLAPALAVVAALQQRKLQGCQQTQEPGNQTAGHMIVPWYTIDAARGASALVTDT
jgi:hypothetical protein